MSKEPLITIGMITATLAALITLLRAFGVPITNEQQDALNQFLVVAAPIVVALVARQYVTPLANPKDATGTPLTRPDNTPAIRKVAK